MTREEAKKEFQKLLEERHIAEERIYEKAVEQGRWQPGLDSNRDLFNGIKLEFEEKVNKLRSQIDE